MIAKIVKKFRRPKNQSEGVTLAAKPWIYDAGEDELGLKVGLTPNGVAARKTDFRLSF